MGRRRTSSRSTTMTSTTKSSTYILPAPARAHSMYPDTSKIRCWDAKILLTYQYAASRSVELHVRTIAPNMKAGNAPAGRMAQ